MTAAPHEAWPIRRLARVAGASEAHFARAFKEAFGAPPHRFLLTLRIERASTLLRETERPIAEIALCCGWASLGTFGRTFRDVTGVSPTECRQRAQTGRETEVPACFARDGRRPDLNIAVSEKRARDGGGTSRTETKERSDE
ncbi:MAG: helix-turn-helix transcriptional regulator [Sandaracinus sp.]|nr:helix-turn-helix transcriptional regulator [Sandaracinus sp.]MCB9619112.1 helix-turn-helix transcriptional regulator [Sandaracinus sp.]MCB9632695.1 helix-turn-helix transcriptional regulator [Sandaracinus sp.]